MDKFQNELERLEYKRELIIELLGILDRDIEVRRKLERINDISFPVRPSIQVEQTRAKWQGELRMVNQDIKGMKEIIDKHDQ